MIGVLVQSHEREIAREFFELFKTPWEFYRRGQRYDVLLSTGEEWDSEAAKLVLLYRGKRLPFDARKNVPVRPGAEGAMFSYQARPLPLYGAVAAFPAGQLALVKDDARNESLTFLSRCEGGVTVRIGYDLFEEVRLLLTVGQPPANAGTPALELHIDLLRELITRSGIPLLEIPPVPDGYEFIACLTHDLDHPALRNHCCDHTMFGFLYRATIGSLSEVCRGRKPLGALARNLGAAAKLPFVYLGIAKDPWASFDRYLEIEAGLGSTYFVIPMKGYPGRSSNGSAPGSRASGYSVDDIKPQLEKIIAAGCEVALHGIDAWLDSDRGGEEREELARSVAAANGGVRMHWLFFDEKSPEILDRGGFSYDSTVGYNETVGYRAGTMQAYRPPGAASLMELPLLVMDTALFYPDRRNLSNARAEQVVWRILDDAARFGGAVTVNWHDRSIAPERLWEDFYLNLLRELKTRGAWFPTASQAVSWFGKRRSAAFGAVSWEDGVVKFNVSANPNPGTPGLRVRVHKPRAEDHFATTSVNSSAGFVDVGFDGNLTTSITVSKTHGTNN
jgi:hypothetical protein